MSDCDIKLACLVLTQYSRAVRPLKTNSNTGEFLLELLLFVLPSLIGDFREDCFN